MIKLKLNNRTYKLPKRYTIEQWKAVVKLDLEDPKSWPIILGTALGCRPTKFWNCREDSLILGASLVLHEMSKRRALKHIDFTTITIGEFIDLDIWLVGGAEKHIDEILGILAGGPIKYIDEALWIIDNYANFRVSTYRSYAGLFGINESGLDGVDVEEYPDPKSVQTGWYRVLVDLADDDILRLDQITEQPLYKTLTFMSLRKERALKEQQQLNKKQRNDISRHRK